MRNYKVYQAIKRGEYPETLTFDQFDMLKWDTEKQFGLGKDDRCLNEIEADVRTLAQVTGSQIYTQVDGDSDRLYARGNRFVNRTGIWWVVKMGGLKVDNA